MTLALDRAASLRSSLLAQHIRDSVAALERKIIECRQSPVFDASVKGMQRGLMKYNLLDTLKESLRSMENVRAVSPDEPHLVRLKQNLRRRIAELEGTGCTQPITTRL